MVYKGGTGHGTMTAFWFQNQRIEDFHVFLETKSEERTAFKKMEFRKKVYVVWESKCGKMIALKNLISKANKSLGIKE